MNVRYADSRRKKQLRFLRALLVFVLFAGLFVQITMLARVSAENKRAAGIEDQIILLNHRAENLERDINSYCNSDEIELLALKLGMQKPDETQLRYINVPNLESVDTSEPAASENGGEKENQ